jgi:hypothetical protein
VNLGESGLKPEALERKIRARNFFHAEETGIKLTAPVQIFYDQGHVVDVFDLNERLGGFHRVKPFPT